MIINHTENKIKKKLEFSKQFYVEKDFHKKYVNKYNYNSPNKKDQKNYRKFQDIAKKNGRLVKVWGLNHFYRLTVWDFLPFFIGNIISISRYIVTYTDLKYSTNYNQNVLSIYKGYYVAGLFISLFFWPIFILLMFAVYPYIVLNNIAVSNTYQDFFNELFNAKSGMIAQAFTTYVNGVLQPIFNTTRNIAITIVFWLFLSMLDIHTFIFYLFFSSLSRKIIFDSDYIMFLENLKKFYLNQNKQQTK